MMNVETKSRRERDRSSVLMFGSRKTKKVITGFFIFFDTGFRDSP
jgi:hypothetical protein